MFFILKGDRPYILPFIPLIALGIWSMQIIHPQFSPHAYNLHPMPLYAALMAAVPPASTVAVLLSIAALLIGAYQVAHLNARYKLIELGTFFPSIIYIMLASFSASARELNPIFFANIFIILALYRMFACYKSGSCIGTAFEAAFFISVASLFYYPSILMALVLWSTMQSLRSFVWREWAASILGLMAPYYLYASYAYFAGELHELVNTVIANVMTDTHSLTQGYFFWIFTGFTTFMLATGIGFSFTGILKKVNSRKYFNEFILMSILAVGAFLVIPGVNVEAFAIIAIPFAFFFSHHLIKMDSQILAEITFIAFTSLFVCFQFLG